MGYRKNIVYSLDFFGVNVILEGFYFFIKFDEYGNMVYEYEYEYEYGLEMNLVLDIYRRICFMFKEFFLFFFVWCLGFLICKCLIVFL